MAKRKTTAAVAEDTVAVAPTETGNGNGNGVADSGADVILKTNFSVIEDDAQALTHAATLLIEADTPEAVSVALNHNLKLWVAIKTVIQDPANTLPDEVKANLKNLAQYVSTTTMEATEGTIEERKLVSLAEVNMHIAEGLLSGQQNWLVQERAYEIWEAEGRPEGRDMEHWLRAEAEIKAMIEGQ